MNEKWMLKANIELTTYFQEFFDYESSIFLPIILLTPSNNQISEFRIPNIYNEILFILLFASSKVGPTVSSTIYNPL